MVIRETLKSIQKLQPLTAEHNVKANKSFLYKVTTIVSTLRVHNFELDSDQSENSALMIHIEENLPQETFLEWEDRKMEVKKSRKMLASRSSSNFSPKRLKRKKMFSSSRVLLKL